MKRYFSNAPFDNSICSIYGNLYKSHTNSKVFIISDGNDLERSVFLNEIVKLESNNATIFTPFYDNNPDGIYLENYDTFILSDGGYNHIAPILPNIFEKYISIAPEKNYNAELKSKIISKKNEEFLNYKNAFFHLKNGGFYKISAIKLLSPFVNHKKVASFIDNTILENFNDTTKGEFEFRLLSSVTPLGFKTYFDTIFDICNKHIVIEDEVGLIGSIILNIIKLYAVKNKIPLIMSPTYYEKNSAQILLLPSIKLSYIIEDFCHSVPFKATERILASSFLNKIPLKTENEMAKNLKMEFCCLDNATKFLFAGREKRFDIDFLEDEFTHIKFAKEKSHNFLKNL